MRNWYIFWDIIPCLIQVCIKVVNSLVEFGRGKVLNALRGLSPLVFIDKISIGYFDGVENSGKLLDLNLVISM